MNSIPGRAVVISTLAGLALALARSLQAADLPVTDEQVDSAIKRGVEFLWSKQNAEGHWDPIATAADIKAHFDTYKNYSGQSALAMIALLNTGVDRTKPEFSKALKWMAEQKPTGTYALGLRCVLWSTLQMDKARPFLEEEAITLQNGLLPNGVYTYLMCPPEKQTAPLPGPPGGDLSNTQYGVLGVWAGADRGVEINPKYWKFVERGYLTCQDKSGGWHYPVNPAAHTGGNKDPRLSVSLGALASLFVIWDYYYARQGCDTKVNPELIKSLNAGIAWAGQDLTRRQKQPQPPNPYCLYGLERVGVASGLKYFGDVDWFREGLNVAIKSQYKDGAWWDSGPICGTSWTILFLEFGWAPVVFNKLDYGKMADWNARPRDLARLTHWMHDVSEKLYNWQIMPIDKPLEELRNAPIVFMSGRTAIKLTDEQKAKLKDCVLSGGLLLGEAAGDSKAFADSFRALMRELFPELEMAPLPPGHPIYTVQFQLGKKQGGLAPNVPPLEGLANGVRTLAVLSPKDLSCAWQQYDVVNKKSSFQLGANIAHYASDRQTGLIRRGTSYLLADAGNKPEKQVTVGRLVWGSKYQWDPEPWGWKRMDVSLRNAKVMAVTTKECDFAAPVDARAIPLVHVTGSGGITLNDACKANLKKYAADGGIILADPAGGNRLFMESFLKLAAELFGPAAPANPPFMAQATENGKLWLRHVDNLPRALRPAELLACPRVGGAGGWSVLILPYDLSAAMAGYPNVEPVGLTPPAAEKFVAALLNSLVSAPAASPPPAPATGPGQ